MLLSRQYSCLHLSHVAKGENGQGNRLLHWDLFVAYALLGPWTQKAKLLCNLDELLKTIKAIFHFHALTAGLDN